MTPRTYSSPEAFRQALEQRFRSTTKTGIELGRKRQRLVFDRLLARIDGVLGDAAILKGGLALELRLDRARATQDVDLRVSGPPDQILAKLQEAGRLRLEDFMTFEVAPDNEHPELLNDGMKYDGFRFRAECKLAGKLYGQRFGVDVAFGDPILGEPDEVVAEDVLSFAGIAPPTLRIYPIETHIAEKLHAYTMPRKQPNTRVKDLPDIALLATAHDPLDARDLREALEQTFSFRATHALPTSVPDPSPDWEKPYATSARLDELQWTSLGEVTKAAQAFLNPIVGGDAIGAWDRKQWCWVA